MNILCRRPNSLFIPFFSLFSSFLKHFCLDFLFLVFCSILLLLILMIAPFFPPPTPLCYSVYYLPLFSIYPAWLMLLSQEAGGTLSVAWVGLGRVVHVVVKSDVI
ncbi:hypothetical protein P170DRAFT_250360 [Aspergillus steynii IBT 23096]|uniref:Uncharacterized protein n=1 Tax=Aspergillus steynii IBT 23096 TaxID=1392250 RepID=A0A2I2FYK2_9EURO|nr:uncharacterized protein P170DRAFT_250360 [Aspergillus steynii IBT 23096]PLB45714.1 hypothetical protein P170DRAFT_250360 [Aspergillus steynii IBT 23096]